MPWFREGSKKAWSTAPASIVFSRPFTGQELERLGHHPQYGLLARVTRQNGQAWLPVACSCSRP